jgi:peptidoglycan/LPS O-acetylase OafA/YrhL
LRSASTDSKYIPTLDGWRALAILMVLAQHSAISAGRNIPVIDHLGPHGVGIFFVLSGYLITTRLLKDGGNLRQFYFHRAFRILPLVFVYLIVLVSMGQFLPVSKDELLSTLFFIRNFTLAAAMPPNGAGWYTLHFWSLALEEQFYLLWPWLLLALSVRKARLLALSGAAAVALWRVLPESFLSHIYDHSYAWYMRPEFHADGLLVGCALGLWFTNPSARQRIAQLRSLLPISAVLWTLLAMGTSGFPSLLESIAAAGMISATMLRPHHTFAKLLESAPLRFLGRISYGLYVWQQLFLSPRAAGHPLGIVQLFPLNLAFTLGVAVVSYRWFERPLIVYAHRRSAQQPLAASA